MDRRSFIELTAVSVASLHSLNAEEHTVHGEQEPIFVGPGATRHADGNALVVPDELQCKVRTSDLSGRVCLMRADHLPFQGAPLHLHRDYDEWFFVEKGEFVVEINGKLFHMAQGASMVGPKGVPHRYINGPATGTLLMGFFPGGRMEEFFEGNARRRRDPNQKPRTHEEAVAYYASYHLDLLGSPLTPEAFREAAS